VLNMKQADWNRVAAVAA